MGKKLLDLAREKRDEVTKEADALVASAETEGRDLTEAEFEIITRSSVAAAPLNDRIKTLAEVEARAAEKKNDLPNVVVRSEPLTYNPNGQYSWFKDLALQQLGRGTNAGTARLERHAREMQVEMEQRAGDTGDTAGGAFVPPKWMLDEYVPYPRSGRPVADLARRIPLPSGTDSINIPTITTGLLTAAQTTENTAITTRDMVTSSTSADVCTVAGYYDFSIQLLEQSAFAGGFDQLVAQDLRADYDMRVDSYVLNGTGTNGQPLGIATVASTTVSVATAAITSLYAGIGDAMGRVTSAILKSPAVIIMSPRRWFWAVTRYDTAGRPLMDVDAGRGQNMLGTFGLPAPQGVVGTMLGLPVVIDPNVTLTSATYNDEVYVWRPQESILMEGTPRFEVFRSTLGTTETLTARARLYNYIAFSARWGAAVAKVNGAGLTGPTF